MSRSKSYREGAEAHSIQLERVCPYPAEYVSATREWLAGWDSAERNAPTPEQTEYAAMELRTFDCEDEAVGEVLRYLLERVKP